MGLCPRFKQTLKDERIPGDDNSVIHDVNENTGEIDNSTDIDVDVEDVVTGPRI